MFNIKLFKMVKIQSFYYAVLYALGFTVADCMA